MVTQLLPWICRHTSLMGQGGWASPPMCMSCPALMSSGMVSACAKLQEVRASVTGHTMHTLARHWLLTVLLVIVTLSTVYWVCSEVPIFSFTE